MTYLSVIIPAYNEEKRITPTLLAVNNYLKRQEYSYEIIVVSDGSTDSTPAIVELLAADIPNLRCVHNKENHGKGWVVRQGMLIARGQYRLFMDADNSTRIDNLERFLPYFEQGYDVLVSSRRIPGASIDVPQTPIRDFLGSVFRGIVHMLVPLGVIDSQNGSKVFTHESAEEIFRRQRTFTWSFDVEILAIARQKGMKLKELPISWTNDGRSHVTLFGMISMLFEILLIRWNIWSGLYRTYTTNTVEEIAVQ